MDRMTVYPGAIPLETDLLNTNRSMMIAMGKLAKAMFGTGGVVNGLAVTAQSPASLSVNVGQGEIYQLENVDSTAYSSLPADTTDQIVKQGIQLGTVALSCPAPSTAGYSINYLIEATYQESDINPVVLPYYNASNPTQAYNGPNNTGSSNTTTRAGQVALVAKAGIAATTGTQTTPAVDAGYIALAVVTVANGQTQITSGNIVAQTGGNLLSQPVSTGRLINVQTFTSSGTYTPTPGTNSIVVEGVGGGGAGGGSPACSSGQATGGAGGGSGAYFKTRLTSGFSGGVAVTIGAGGVGASGVAGTSGGTTSFGAFASAPGGGFGTAGSATSTFPQINGYGASASVATGGSLINAGGGLGSSSFALGPAAAISGSGGTSEWSGNANSKINTTSPGVNASGPGGGGSGALTMANGAAQTGGNGAPGQIIVYEYA